MEPFEYDCDLAPLLTNERFPAPWRHYPNKTNGVLVSKPYVSCHVLIPTGVVMDTQPDLSHVSLPTNQPRLALPVRSTEWQLVDGKVSLVMRLGKGHSIANQINKPLVVSGIMTSLPHSGPVIWGVSLGWLIGW